MKKKTTKNKTIVICSSASFFGKVIEVEKELKKIGFKVKIPLVANKMKKTGDFRVETYKTWFADASTYNKKTFLIKDHFKKILTGNCVLVLNYEKNGKSGYIGGATLMEMAMALHFGKKIYILNPIQDDVSYKEEILAMMPVILNGDLKLIS